VIASVFAPSATGVRAEIEVDHDAHAVRARCSGYIQLLDVEQLIVLARGKTVQLTRPIGGFVPAGGVLFRVSEQPSSADEHALLLAVDIGSERTLQDDAEYGVRQIVDIALKAISPAVNDPSTAATCIDQLGALIILAGGGSDPPNRFSAEDGGKLELLLTSLDDLIDLAVEQIRQYSKTEMAVSLRLVRTLTDVREAIPRERGEHTIRKQLAFIEASASKVFGDEDREELNRRLARARAARGL